MEEKNQAVREAGLFNGLSDSVNEGRDKYDVDIDRMVNEGLGGGNVTQQNGLIEASTTDTIIEGENLGEES
ncbi:hypothetical protein E0485_14395 [Paenibacillus albiflavus]|uniref:Uncharacterized protein n=1 Tax=Paenibacillus albiflavus TaxID=2545760 RepID=A0A4R4E977_9BACL|nr:hypothetical protein [Paenibacillus albiflavus]TCZ76384.1 hypothetical protein E0485_14395 [Paenibacillus albiflavus]